MADSWVHGFKNGGVYFDSHAKELVKVTNGRCTLAHDSPEAYAASHTNGGCVYEPSEASAIRPIAVTGKRPRFQVGWTYRSVRREALWEATSDSAAAFDAMFAQAKVGRV